MSAPINRSTPVQIAPSKPRYQSDVEVTVLMPCLNEEEGITESVFEAKRGIELAGVTGEVLVVDNGSEDRSVELARAAGARVVHESNRGYGNAYLRGFDEARGEYIIIGDADGTYDFTQIPEFVDMLRSGYDFVNGSRTKGKMSKGAMPFSHRYIGVPILSWMLNWMSGARLSDAHCGIRAFTRDAVKRMRLCMPGMEFASEIIMQAARAKLNVGELPVPYRNRRGSSKLRTLSDGWRHLRFMLLYSPSHLFLIPGIAAIAVGILMMLALLGGPIKIAGYTFDLHYLVVGSLLALLGVQVTLLGINARILSASRGILRDDRLFLWFERYFTLERGALSGGTVALAGLVVLGAILGVWISRGFGFSTDTSIRFAVLGLTLLIAGTQMVFSSFFVSLLFMRFDGSPSERLLQVLDERYQQQKSLRTSKQSDAA